MLEEFGNSLRCTEAPVGVGLLFKCVPLSNITWFVGLVLVLVAE